MGFLANLFGIHNDSNKTSASHSSPACCVRMESVRLYSTGVKGKVYTNHFYRSVNHNFGIEVRLKNTSNTFQQVFVSQCIYDNNGTTIAKGNVRVKLDPYQSILESLYINANTFSSMKLGQYKSQLWLDNVKVQKAFFTINK